MRCALSCTHMTAGTSQSILIDVHTAIPHLESKWLRSLQTCLSMIDAIIEVDDPGILPFQRVADSYLMISFLIPSSSSRPKSDASIIAVYTSKLSQPILVYTWT